MNIKSGPSLMLEKATRDKFLDEMARRIKSSDTRVSLTVDEFWCLIKGYVYLDETQSLLNDLEARFDYELSLSQERANVIHECITAINKSFREYRGISPQEVLMDLLREKPKPTP